MSAARRSGRGVIIRQLGIETARDRGRAIARGGSNGFGRS
jgi:hypothetical protein